MPRAGVQYATWRDFDLKNLRYTVTGEGKSDVAFVPKNHEERSVPLTTELGSLLAEHKKHAASDRWVFTNEGGKSAEGRQVHRSVGNFAGFELLCRAFA